MASSQKGLPDTTDSGDEPDLFEPDEVPDTESFGVEYPDMDRGRSSKTDYLSVDISIQTRDEEVSRSYLFDVDDGSDPLDPWQDVGSSIDAIIQSNFETAASSRERSGREGVTAGETPTGTEPSSREPGAHEGEADGRDHPDTASSGRSLDPEDREEEAFIEAVGELLDSKRRVEIELLSDADVVYEAMQALDRMKAMADEMVHWTARNAYDDTPAESLRPADLLNLHRLVEYLEAMGYDEDADALRDRVEAAFERVTIPESLADDLRESMPDSLTYEEAREYFAESEEALLEGDRSVDWPGDAVDPAELVEDNHREFVYLNWEGLRSSDPGSLLTDPSDQQVTGEGGAAFGTTSDSLVFGRSGSDEFADYITRGL